MQITRRIMIAGLLLASAAALILALARRYRRAVVQMFGWDEPWESRRGAEHADYNGTPLLIRATIEDVAGALASRTQRWDKNVLGREVELERGRGAFVFRLRGHEWTIIVFDGLVLLLSEAEKQAVSAQLGTRVIDYWTGDTSGTIGYRFYDKGELQEEFSATEGDTGAPDDSSTFSSRLREIKISEIPDSCAFASQFLADQEAYEPSLSFDYFLGTSRPNPGELVRIVNPGIVTIIGPGRQSRATPPIERVDYLVLKPSSG